VATVAFIGFGELGVSLGAAFAKAGHELRAWTRPRADASALTERLEAAGARRSDTLEDAVRGAELVISAVPGAASPAVARDCIPLIAAGACFADMTAAAPAAKEDAARAAAGRGVLYADGAVLGTVAASGHEVPIAAAGTGAEAFRALGAPAGLQIAVIAGEAGQAARLKLIRSVFMKGRDALVLEMMIAARRLGLEDEVAASIAGPGEQVPFPELSDRVLRALAIHAERRAEELASSGDVLREAGVDPIGTTAAGERLRRLGELGLRERLHGVRPDDGSTTLDAAAGEPPPF
jgi:3-hydroxyisobutyrate dehydrogenase-like beta-hydroxyacid dehydrogenase